MVTVTVAALLLATMFSTVTVVIVTPVVFVRAAVVVLVVGKANLALMAAAVASVARVASAFNSLSLDKCTPACVSTVTVPEPFAWRFTAVRPVLNVVADTKANFGPVGEHRTFALRLGGSRERLRRRRRVHEGIKDKP